MVKDATGIFKRALEMSGVGCGQMGKIEGEHEVGTAAVVSDPVEPPQAQPDVHIVRIGRGSVELGHGLLPVTYHRLGRPWWPASSARNAAQL